MSLLDDLAGMLTSPTGQPRASRALSRQVTDSHHAVLDYRGSHEAQAELTRRLMPWARQRLIGGPLRHA
jgi:hypothetical protein